MAFVDNVLVVVTNLRLGSRYVDGKIIHSEQVEDQDKQEERTAEQVTMEILKLIANEIVPFLKFTTEVSGGPANPVPCLDSQLWFGKIK